MTGFNKANLAVIVLTTHILQPAAAPSIFIASALVRHQSHLNLVRPTSECTVIRAIDSRMQQASLCKPVRKLISLPQHPINLYFT